jgi:hypothetical protein
MHRDHIAGKPVWGVLLVIPTISRLLLILDIA